LPPLDALLVDVSEERLGVRIMVRYLRDEPAFQFDVK
jgi:hypothetical protein